MVKKSLFIATISIIICGLNQTKAQKKGEYAPYKPSKEFLKQNPHFLVDSNYALSYKYGLMNITSVEYPVKSVKLEKEWNKNYDYKIQIIEGDYDIGNYEIVMNIPAKVYSNTVHLLIEGKELFFGKAMPNVVIFEMTVVNNIFEPVATAKYKQAVFYEESKQMKGKVFEICLEQAKPNLMAQFANDIEAQNKIAQAMTQVAQYSQDYIVGIENLQKLRQIRIEKEYIIYILKQDFDMVADAERMEKELRENKMWDAARDAFKPLTPQPKPNVTVDAISAGVGGFLNMLGEERAKKQAANKQAAANRLINQYKNLQHEEIALYTDLQSKGLINQKDFVGKETVSIDDIANSIKQGAEQLRGAISNTSSYSQSKIDAQFSAMQRAISTNTTTLNSSGISTVQPPASSDECNNQATYAWKNSSEYKAYLQTPTNANASDSKAKLIELTLQYCGSKLPANEVAALKQGATNERKIARDLRAGTPNIRL
jgi:hypothetical protein